ncbi:MAG TPA: ABC transporter permease, partial [Chthoniobacterales bacterium]
MMSDIRYALRQLIQHPGFTIVAVLTLALGIGANTAIFSVVNAVLLKPLPFPASEQLVALGGVDLSETAQPRRLYSLSFPDFSDLREQNRSFSSMAVYRDRSVGLVDETGARVVRGQKVSGEFFDVLGVKPILGRGFGRADEQPGGGPGGLKVVLGYGFWKRHFNLADDVIGRVLMLDGRPNTVIGVMPEGFTFPIQTDATDLYTTVAEDASSSDGSTPKTQQRGDHWLQGIARLKTGVALAQANAELRTIAAALEKRYPETNTKFSAGSQPLRDEMVGDIKTALYVLFGAVACLLLIANANVANLMLARASVRGKEIALRAALGASRGRIIRQLLTESVLLAAFGGLLGLLIAQWGTEALVAAYPKPENIVSFFDQLLSRVGAIPGVESVTAVWPLPLSGSNNVSSFDIEERPMPEGQQPDSPMRIVARDYFKTMGIPVRQGRGFEETDQFKSLPVLVVNEHFAQKFFPGQNAIGKRINPGWAV